MAEMTTLGRSEVRVSRLGLGVMIWGEASGVQRVMPAKSAYGGTNAADEQAAFDASLAAEINFFDTAAMYSAGGSESLRRARVSLLPPSSRLRQWDVLKICPRHLMPA